MSSGTTEIGYLCHHGHYCFHADPDEGGQCGTKRVGTITLTFDDTDVPEDWTELVASAQGSLAEKYDTWRKCDCEGSAAYVKEADDLLVSVERRAERAEAKIRELVELCDKRYEQWQAAEARTVEVLRDLAKDARIRGDVGKEGGVEAWDYLNLYADKIERDDRAPRPRTPEEKIAFRKKWDADYEAGQKRKAQRKALNELIDLEVYCPHCFESVSHEDDHLQGDRDVNAWFECPGDERPVA